MSWLKKIEPISPHGLFRASALMLALSLILSAFNAASTLAAPLQATIPTKVGFEGYLTDPANSANPLPTGSYSILFSLYSVASGGTASWTETQTVSVTNGYFAVQLGSVTSLSASTFSGNQWIGVKVGTNAEVSPRTPISAVPFALNAETANSATSATNATNATNAANATNATNATNASSVPWSGVSSKPAGFADGVDDNSGGTITGSGTAGQLPVLATGTSLGNSGITASGGMIQTSTPVFTWVYNNASIPIANATWVAVTFNSESWDTDSIHSTTSNTSRLQCTRVGAVMLSGGFRWVANATGNRGIAIRYNGGTIWPAITFTGAISTNQNMSVSTTYYCSSTSDYFELMAYQNITPSANLSMDYTSVYPPFFSMARVP